MFKNIFSVVGIIYLLVTTNLSAQTIKKAVVEVIDSNPQLKEKLRRYRAFQQDLSMIESQYYPTIDLKASFGFNKSSGFINDINISADNDIDSFDNYKASLTLTQNLFNGFGTKNRIDYSEYKILVSAYQYLATSNAITFSMVKSYLDVLRFEELLKIAVKDVQMSEITYQKIETLFEADKITLSEIKKIQSILSRSKSNLVIQLAKAREAKFRYRRIAGRMPDVENMQKPDYRVQIPKSSELASLYAINHNPALLVNRYRVKSLQALRKAHTKDFYPTLDLELTQNYVDSSENNIYTNPDDRFQAKIVFNYNIYNGGADSANAQKYISITDAEIEKGRALKRKIIEDVDMGWSIYDMTNAQLKDLRDYSLSTEEAFTLYQEEFSQGSRSLIELLLVQNDVIEAQKSVINAEYDSLLAKYKILNATGRLFIEIVGNQDFTARVNLFTEHKKTTILDSDLVKFDVDNDNISDNQDLCDNSVLENNIMPYGCKKIDKFSARIKKMIEYKKHNHIVLPTIKPIKKEKNIVHSKQIVIKKKPIIKKHSTRKKVVKKAEIIAPSFIEENSINREELLQEDSFADDYNLNISSDIQESKADGCVDVPSYYKTDRDGCATSVVITLSKHFENLGRNIPKNIQKKILELASFMKKNTTITADIIGYSSRTPVSNYKYNVKISKERAQRFKNELIKQDVFSYRLTTDGRGYRNPIADNNTKAGRNLNRRVEVIFSR